MVQSFFLPVFVARSNLHFQAVLLEVHFKGDFADNGRVLLDYFIDVNSMDLCQYPMRTPSDLNPEMEAVHALLHVSFNVEGADAILSACCHKSSGTA